MVNITPSGAASSLLQGSGLTKPTPGAGGTSFFDMLKSGVESVHDSQAKSEQLTTDALMGKADLTQVVQGVAKAEVMLQTMVSIRDRLLTAYQEIMNTRI